MGCVCPKTKSGNITCAGFRTSACRSKVLNSKKGKVGVYYRCMECCCQIWRYFIIILLIAPLMLQITTTKSNSYNYFELVESRNLSNFTELRRFSRSGGIIGCRHLPSLFSFSLVVYFCLKMSKQIRFTDLRNWITSWIEVKVSGIS